MFCTQLNLPANFTTLSTTSNKHHNGIPDSLKQLLNLVFVNQSQTTTYAQKGGNSFVAVLAYVDDIMIINPSLKAFHLVKDLLYSEFKLKNLGNIKYFLA